MANGNSQEIIAAEWTAIIFAGCTGFVLVWLFLESLLNWVRSNFIFNNLRNFRKEKKTDEQTSFLVFFAVKAILLPRKCNIKYPLLADVSCLSDNVGAT